MDKSKGRVIPNNIIEPGSIYITYYSDKYEFYPNYDMVVVKEIRDDGKVSYNKFIRENYSIMKSQSYDFFEDLREFKNKYKKFKLIDSLHRNIKINETYSVIDNPNMDNPIKNEFYIVKISGCDIKNQEVYFRGLLNRDIETKKETIDHQTTAMRIDVFLHKYELFMF